MRYFLLLSLVAAALAQRPSGRANPSNSDPGFTVTVEKVSMPSRIGSIDYGVLVLFASNDPDVVAFAGEVAYRVAGSATDVRHVPAYCMRNYSGHGGLYLWIGQVEDVSVDAWEVKSLGRSSHGGN